MKTILTCGVLGCGAYGRIHMRAYRTDGRARLKAIWSPTKERREQAAKEFECRAADSWQAIMDDPEIECVSIATPDYAHTEYAVAALNAGKHVLLEKPMAMSVRECAEIIKARDLSGRKLMINYHNRWYPPFIKAREVILSGEIGKPVCGNFVLSDTVAWLEQHMKWANRSGPEWFLMTHIADLACWMLNDKPVDISAMAHAGFLKTKGFNTRDIVKAMLVMGGGAIIHLESSWMLARNWRNPVNEMQISIQCERGRVDIGADHENVTIVNDAGYQTPFVYLDLTETPPIRDFISCVVEDKPSPVTGEEGLLATQVVEDIVAAYTKRKKQV